MFLRFFSVFQSQNSIAPKNQRKQQEILGVFHKTNEERVTPHFIKRIPETALRSELSNIWRKKCHVTCSSRPMYPLTNASIRLKSFPVRSTEAKVICSDSLIGRGYKISNERGASSMLCLNYYIRPRLQQCYKQGVKSDASILSKKKGLGAHCPLYSHG